MIRGRTEGRKERGKIGTASQRTEWLMMISYLLLVFTSWWRLIDYQDLRFTRPVPTIHSRTAPYCTVHLIPTIFLVAANGTYDLLHSSPTLVKAYNARTVIYTIFTLSLPWSLFRCMYVRIHMRLNISTSASNHYHLFCLSTVSWLITSHPLCFLIYPTPQGLGDSRYRRWPGLPFPYGKNVIDRKSVV